MKIVIAVFVAFIFWLCKVLKNTFHILIKCLPQKHLEIMDLNKDDIDLLENQQYFITHLYTKRRRNCGYGSMFNNTVERNYFIFNNLVYPRIKRGAY